MPRTWQELTAAANATGTFSTYSGDGASVPSEVVGTVSLPLGLALGIYKRNLDASYPEAFRLHDWLYTPYGSLIGATKEEADEALREHILDTGGRTSTFDALLVYGAVSLGPNSWFGNSQTGFDPKVFAGAQLALSKTEVVMAVYKGTLLLQFVGTPPCGFSESYEFSADSDAAAKTAIAAWPVPRSKWLSQDWRVVGFRLSKETTSPKTGKSLKGNTTINSPTITGISSTAGLSIGQGISGAGIPAGATITQVDPSSITIDLYATATQNQVQLSVPSASSGCKKTFAPLLIQACPTPVAGILGRSDTPFTAVLTRITFLSDNFKPRNLMMRGIPDDWWDAAALTVPPGQLNAFTVWFNFMKGNKVGRNSPAPTGCGQNFSQWQTACLIRIASRRIGRPFDLLRGRRRKKKAT